MAVSKEAEFVLRTVEERGIEFIRLWFTDVLGTLKSFAITPQELEGAFAEGMGFDGSSIDGFSRIQESDMVALPDPATFQIVPWRSEAGVARMFCDVLNPDGSPFEGDPRYVLKRQLRRASELGFSFYVGRHVSVLKPLTLYEFDFQAERTCSYTPSLSLPDAEPEKMTQKQT